MSITKGPAARDNAFCLSRKRGNAAGGPHAEADPTALPFLPPGRAALTVVMISRREVEGLRDLARQAHAHPIGLADLAARMETAEGRAEHAAHLARQTFLLPTMDGPAIPVSALVQGGGRFAKFLHLCFGMPDPALPIALKAAWSIGRHLGLAQDEAETRCWIGAAHEPGLHLLQPLDRSGSTEAGRLETHKRGRLTDGC